MSTVFYVIFITHCLNRRLRSFWAVLELSAIVVGKVSAGVLVELLNQAIKLPVECRGVLPAAENVGQLVNEQKLCALWPPAQRLAAQADSV